jgi:hypothetical protein
MMTHHTEAVKTGIGVDLITGAVAVQVDAIDATATVVTDLRVAVKTMTIITIKYAISVADIAIVRSVSGIVNVNDYRRSRNVWRML